MVPANRDTPIAAELALAAPAGYPVAAVFDWRQEGPQSWDIVVEAEGGRLALGAGGGSLAIDGAEVPCGPEREYPGIYRRFAELVRARAIDVDASPLRIVADAFLLGKREPTEPFHD